MSAVMERDAMLEPVANETLDRFLTGMFTVVPFLAVGWWCCARVAELPALERPRRLRRSSMR